MPEELPQEILDLLASEVPVPAEIIAGLNRE